MTTTFSGQRVAIVGGTSGLGLATAHLLADAGAELIVVGRRNVDAALDALPGAVGASVDVRDGRALADLFAGLGPLDHLAYSAGEPLSLDAVDDLDLATARERMETRLWGAWATVKHGHRQIRPGGSIVLTSGSAGARPQATWALGATVCGAIEAFTRTMALELAPVRVNAVAPGVVRTDLWRDLSPADREALYAGVGAALPVGRVGEAGEVARAYAYLMASEYTTGTVLPIDGGTLLV